MEPLVVRTDIHCHVLPGIDDGAKTVEDGADLVEMLGELGVEKILASPHVTDEVFPNTSAIIENALAELRGELKARGIGIGVSAGAENRIDDLMLTNLEKGTLRPMADDYVLIECPWINEPFGLDVLVKKLVEKHGLKPVLAHPERYPYYLKRPSAYDELRRMGIRFQVNLLSLSGHYGSEIRRMAEEMLDRHMVEFIGSDVHHRHHIESIRRYLASRDYRILQRNAASLLNDTLFYDKI